jgi:putative peptidoglycan lipid II flippase
LSNPSVRRLLKLSTWTIGYVIANQVAIIVVKNLASPGSGLVDAYGKAFVLFQLPHGLLAVSIATTFVPMLARHVQANDFRAFGERMSQGLRLTILVTLPASISALVLSTPIVYIVLGYGNFDAAAVTNTARALSGLAFGLVGFSVYLFALRGFYARSDTRTPFLVNIALAFLLVDRFDVLGLGVAFGVSYIVGAIVAVYALGRAVPSWNASQLRVPVARHIGAGTVMTLLTVATTQAFDTTSRLTAVADILLSALVGLTAYIVVLAIAGDTDVRAGVARYSAASTTKSSR